ncbi:LysR family transcriptional regulator [Krasilnikoviella flava]|uniref:DNA-binding transcriptional regulator, LysR family n=1 Tax=Krasilnikoviella flava TaxID=526729 RepID=A0A1T5K5K6_9MICO|nr:LysR family transcriptional regulator [Krasilnikoviella flava]SKC58738.1 DNA-binding transcriptional regulator, LysR family [Krasilnikoviella flava]
MELRDIEIFLTLAEELHFGRTAERLHITPSRVSHVIKTQERRVGAALFERTSRTVRLTPLGRQLRDDLLPAYQQIQQAIDRAAADARSITGTLRVGYTTPWGADLAYRAAEAFQGRYAGCSIRVQEVPLDDPLGPLRRGELELHISELPVQVPGVTEGPVLFSETRALMVPSGHPLARLDGVSLEHLAEVPLIGPRGAAPAAMREAHVPARTPSGLVVPRGPSYALWSEVPALVAAGLGASIVAARAERYHDRPGIVFVPFHDGPRLEYGVLWRTAGHAPAGRAFVDLLVDLSGAHPDDD